MITLPRIAILFSLVGIYYVNWRKQRTGFLFHTIAAFIWAYHWYALAQTEALGSMLFSAASSLAGWYRWGKI